ncbi:NUDIX hydrolase [Patescibacteria group bacterium]|nr:NUDIX hydrolase [Patescibacteria group bacterium]
MSKYDPSFKPVKHYALVGQKIIISNNEGQILLLQRSEKSGSGGQWSIPGGGLDKGENSEEVILREVEEEIQVTVNNPKPYYVRTYLNKDNDFVVIVAYRAKFEEGKIILNWEHDDCKWVKKQEAFKMDLTVDARDIIDKWSSTQDN